MVHAHSVESITASVLPAAIRSSTASSPTTTTLKLMADKGVYFDPQVGLVLQNYLDNRAKYDGIGNYNEEGFAAMERALPMTRPMFKQAMKTPDLKMVFGTDAVAGAHGRNAEELVGRVRDGGQTPMDAIISATSLSAKSLRLGKTIGTIAPGLQGRPHRGGRRPDDRHHGALARGVRDERRPGVQARRAGDDTWDVALIHPRSPSA